MGISKEKIIDASIHILNRDGIDSLTMRAVAKELEIKASSLYWHIKDKHELYGMLAEHVCSQIVTSAGLNEPKKHLYEICTKYRARLLELRDSVEIFIHSEPITPKRAEILENIKYCLSRTGVRNENLLTAANMLQNYVLLFVADEKIGKQREKSFFYYESQFLYGLEVLFAGFKAISPSK